MQRRDISEMGRGKVITWAIIIALVLGATVFYLFYTGRFGGGSKLKITSPSRLGYEWSKVAAGNNIVSDYLFSRSKTLIVEKGGDGILAATSYTIAGRLVTQEAVSSGTYGLSDQALLLKCYVRGGDRAKAVALKEEVIKRFKTSDGAYVPFVYKDPDKNSGSVRSSAATIEWLDAMMEYYVTYGSDVDYNEIKSLVGILFDNEGRIKPEKLSVAKYAESLYVSLEDTSGFKADDAGSLEQRYGTITGDSEGDLVDTKEQEAEIEGVLLSSINLRLIRDLENNKLIAEGAYEKALKSVKGGFAGGGYSFYAYATSGKMDCGDYVYSGHDVGVIDVGQNLKTMKNLAEVGELDAESYAEFKGTALNSGRIYNEFVMMTGNYAGNEALNAYTDGLMIAYYMNDKDLYNTLSVTLGRRVATKSTSPAIYMIFREEDERYVFYARENFSARMATS